MELPAIGNHCSQSACSKLDFLPFNCHKCGKVFCEDHYKASTHACRTTAFEDARSHKCPLCRQQLAVRRGENPNVTVERHIAQGCQTGKAKTGGISSACTFKGCKKKELVPMTCKECRQQFCIQHRFPDEHACHGVRGAVAARATARQAAAKPKPKASARSASTVTSRPAGAQQTGSGSGYDEQAAIQAAIAASMQADQPAELTEDEAIARAIQESMKPPSSSNSAKSNDGCHLQ